ncbi:MarR family winged helix-turn-helix transcriptional regulator [Amycolatopsis thermophila]|uniref:DNA-binding MarR family transcriptional regulator n=1 Tax=Amycolatopsis thermophila TaxID=206084 RepID=A0ABU0EW27_9PSEU|nr:MarR family transcriptional regulator [Amycolatopsis thermophila]MDQ0379090.1 DNA-binding MarR family transcriptional regulator [Amycolatopsis thermophila]
MPELDVAELTAVMERFTRMNIRLPVQQRLSCTTLSVLHTLTTRGPKRLGELTADEQVTQSAVTQMVTKLERQGLVERRPDPSDGRAVLVHVTPAGAAIVDGRRAERVEHLERFAAALSPADRRAIAAALPALARLVELSEGNQP